VISFFLLKSLIRVDDIPDTTKLITYELKIISLIKISKN